MNTSNRDLHQVFNWGSPPMRERSKGREGEVERDGERVSGAAGEAGEEGATIGAHDFSVLPIDTIADLHGGLH